jgi:uroporphyrin-III C-methyltransferase
VTSALSAPLFAQIPVTHRGVSDQVVICTGTGRKGASPNPPARRKEQTVVFLMALHRLGDLVASLIGSKDGESTIIGAGYPPTTPCAVIERASCPDQRIVRTTLQSVCAAIEEEGSRPPGLLVVGEACGVLKGLGGARWVVEDGWRGLDGIVEADGFGVGKDVLEELREVIATPGVEGKKAFV